MKLASKDLPLQEITLRKYESPQNLSPEELAKKYLLSVGLLQPGESRDILVSIFRILLLARKKKQAVPISKFLELLKNRPGSSEVNIRRQLRRLRDMKLADRTLEGYKMIDSVANITENFIIPFVINQSVERLREYSQKLD